MAASFSAASFFAIREEEDQNQMKQQHSSTPPSSSTTPPAPAPPQKKRKNHQPGTPYPDAEVIALSPKTLMATNRFVCEVCNKGFQREQNLQLHRRGHNLPWKLKQKSNNKDQPPPKRKVYLCPEPTCVHHEPSRALGDLTGIKKHFSRKHGEKKWKCDKCSKKYAVQSDWKAHSKTCGTREYRCDCGTLFSRRDSFITHRAFCDALAQESAATQPPNHLSSAISISSQLYNGNGNNMSFAALSQIDQNDNNMLRFGNTRTGQFNHILSPPPPQQQITLQTPSLFNIPLEPNQNQNQNFNLPFLPIRGTNTNSNINLLFSENFNNEEGSIFFPEGPLYHHSPISPHMSATALLQKAAQMGVSSSSNSSNSNNNNNTASSSLLRSFGGITKSDHRAVLLSANNGNNNNNNMQELMNSFAAGFEEACEYNNNNHDGMDHHRGDPKVETMMSSIGGGSDGFTRDFLGVSEIVRNMSGAVSQREQQQQQQQQRGFNLEAEKNTNAAPLTGQSFGGGGNFQ